MIRSEYIVTLDDFKEAMKGYRRQSMKARISYVVCIWIFPFAGFAFALSCVYMMIVGGLDSSWSTDLMIAVVLGVALGIPARYRMSIRRAFELRNVLAKSKPMFFEFDEDQLRFVVPGGTEISYPWSSFTDLFENDTVVVLFIGEAAFHTIPKRAMNEDGWVQFHLLAAGKLRTV